MKTRSPKQEVSRLLKMKQYSGCRGQISYHGCNEVSIQLFRENNCVYDISYKYEQREKGKITIKQQRKCNRTI